MRLGLILLLIRFVVFKQSLDDQIRSSHTGVIMESKKQVKWKMPDELLEVLKGRRFLRQEGWWSFEFCYHEKIRQFHAEDEKVRFVCSEPKGMISSITELSTCKYALTVQCPMLCKHPLYQEERQVWHTINCNLLPKNQKMKESAKEEKIECVSGMTFFALLQVGRANEE